MLILVVNWKIWWFFFFVAFLRSPCLLWWSGGSDKKKSQFAFGDWTHVSFLLELYGIIGFLWYQPLLLHYFWMKKESWDCEMSYLSDQEFDSMASFWKNVIYVLLTQLFLCPCILRKGIIGWMKCKKLSLVDQGVSYGLRNKSLLHFFFSRVFLPWFVWNILLFWILWRIWSDIFYIIGEVFHSIWNRI